MISVCNHGNRVCPTKLLHQKNPYLPYIDHHTMSAKDPLYRRNEIPVPFSVEQEDGAEALYEDTNLTTKDLPVSLSLTL